MKRKPRRHRRPAEYRRTIVVGIRLRPDEYTSWLELAQREQRVVSEWARVQLNALAARLRAALEPVLPSSPEQ